VSNLIELFGNPNLPLHDALTVLQAHAFFPKNNHDAELFIALERLDAKRTASLTEKADESFVINAVSNALVKRMGQVSIAGIVAHAYLFLQNRGIAPSLERASLLTSELAYNIYGAEFGFGENVSKTVKTAKLNADQAGVKAAFRSYRSVAHILAAKMAVPKELRLIDPSHWKEGDILAFVNSVIFFKERLSIATDTSRWELLEFDVNPSVSTNGAAVWTNYRHLDAEFEVLLQELTDKGQRWGLS
jgi:hypothetical protein